MSVGFACPGCSRTFFAESGQPFPCPVCGRMLEPTDAPSTGDATSIPDVAESVKLPWESDTAKAAEAPAQEAEAGSEDLGSWLNEQTQQLAAPPVQPAAGAGVPSSWLGGADQAAAPPEAPAAVPGSEDLGSWLNEQTQQLGAAPLPPQPPPQQPAPPQEDDTQTIAYEDPVQLLNASMGMPEGAPPPPRPSSRMSAARPAQTARRWTAAALVAACIALLIGGGIFLFIRGIGPLAPLPPDPTPVAGVDQKPGATGKGAEESQSAEEELKRRALEEKVEELRQESLVLKESLQRRSEAGELVLQASRALDGRLDAAASLRLAAKALTHDPGFPAAHRAKARALAGLGRVREALVALEESDKAARAAGDPGDVEALFLAGEICSGDLNDRKAAREYYDRGAAAAPDSPYGRLAEARSLLLQGDRDGAVGKADEIGDNEPPYPLALVLIGEVAAQEASLESGEDRAAFFDEADLLLAKAVRLAPRSPSACLQRARLLLDEAKHKRNFGLARFERLVEAERLLLIVTRVAPSRHDAYLTLAEISLEKGALHDPKAAVERAEEAVRLTERKSAPALATLGEALAATGDPAGAFRITKDALDLEPTNRKYRSALKRYEADGEAVTPP